MLVKKTSKPQSSPLYPLLLASKPTHMARSREIIPANPVTPKIMPGRLKELLAEKDRSPIGAPKAKTHRNSSTKKTIIAPVDMREGGPLPAAGESFLCIMSLSEAERNPPDGRL